MSEVIKVQNRQELIEYIDKGYRFSPKLIMDFFRLSRTQYYDYVYNSVGKVKVPKKFRTYKKESESDGYVDVVLSWINMFDESVLYDYDEVFLSLVGRDLLVFELYDNRTDTYTAMNHSEVISNYDLLNRALIKSKTRRDHEQALGLRDNLDVDEKTIQSRFYSMLRISAHIRIVVCGVHLYSLIHEERDNVPDELEIKEEYYEMVKKVRGT